MKTFLKLPPRLRLIVFLLAAASITAARADVPATNPHKVTLAVLPFIGVSEKEKALAERMRFAVSQKMSNDANGGGQFDRLDNVQVEQVISALQISWATATPDDPPSDDDLQKVLTTLATDKTILGFVKNRTLTLRLYDGQTLNKTASVEIPSDKESPKFAVQKVLTDLTGVTFATLRMVEADHSNPAVEKLFASRPNLVADPGFELAATNPGQMASNWHIILGSKDEAVPLITATAAASLGEDSVAVVPKSVAGGGGGSKDAKGHCLMMRMSKTIAESNGLACISTWIPVENGKKYRFAVNYLSKGPTARLFLKGFGYQADQYGNKSDPEATRRQYYEAEVLPRTKNSAWEAIEMDITPSPLKPTYPKIEWMRLDLYVYLTPGDIFFDDVTLKKIDP